MGGAEVFMWALLVLDVGATAAYLVEGKFAVAGVWFSYAGAQVFWVLIAKGIWT